MQTGNISDPSNSSCIFKQFPSINSFIWAETLHDLVWHSVTKQNNHKQV